MDFRSNEREGVLLEGDITKNYTNRCIMLNDSKKNEFYNCLHAASRNDSCVYD